MLIHIPQSQKFSRAVGEAAERTWNHPVLELHGGEPMMSGQWRFIPGRCAIENIDVADDRLLFDLTPNRSTDEDRAIGYQLKLLTRTESGLLRIFLCDLPGPEQLEVIGKLIDNDQIVLLHSGALPGAAGCFETNKQESSGVVSGPWLLDKASGRCS